MPCISPIRRGILVGLVLWVGFPAIAFADPAGPTDYLTSIVAIEPPTGAIKVSVVGGDAFINLEVKPGHEAMVLGYQEESYLRFDPDGSVWENQLSEATYYNTDRFGGEIPPEADSTASPSWRQVGNDGTFAWHDHRAHWMSEQRLIGLQPGDTLPRQHIAIVVDGQPVTIEVETVLQPEPSIIPVVLGALGACIAILLALAIWKMAGLAVMAIIGGVGSVILGVAMYLSVPTSTGPPWWWVVLPVAALISAIVALVLPSGHYARPVAVVGTGLFIAVWSSTRFDHLRAAYVPSTLPADIDRGAGFGLGVLAIALLVGGTAQLITGA